MSCSCLRCDDCKGTGLIWSVQDDGMEESDFCEECCGSGTSDKCAECEQADIDAEDMQEFMVN